MPSATAVKPFKLDRGPFGDLPATLEWVGDADGTLRLLDQTLLPGEVRFIDCGAVELVWEAIKTLRVRGAPAIGVAAAYGAYIGVRPARDRSSAEFQRELERIAAYLIAARPTAVNLAWAVRRVCAIASKASGASPSDICAAMLSEAHIMAQEDVDVCRKIGEFGADLIPAGGGVLTHCNAGALATVAYGTALAPMYIAHRRGVRFRAFADETRPLLQGARLTAYELHAAGIDVTVLCDGAAASLMAAGNVQLVIVGADRIAANGDTANKVGTFPLALAARHHGVPFFVAAPLSTFDVSIASGAEIPIEQRSPDEVRSFMGRTATLPGVNCYNPAFDVTPASLIRGIITERGIVSPPSEQAIRLLCVDSGGG